MKVLKIGAEWCAICLVMKPRWAEIEKENPWLKTEYLDYDKNQQQLEEYNIDSDLLPIFVFLDKKEKEIDRRTGEISKKELLELINKHKEK